MKSTNGETWTFVSLVNHRVNYEAMLEYHDGKFWVMCRNGGTTPSNNKQQNLLYSEDGITWTQSNLSLETSDTRPYMFTYQGELYMAYSSPLPTNYSTVRNWRCNIHIGKIVSSGGVETFEEVVYKESKFGIVYYTVTDWYGNMVMLYSSGELNPTEGLMGGWSQGKDCVNYTILKSEEPELSFKTLSSISITAEPNVTEYAVGDTFDPTGLVVKAKFTDNTYSTVTNYTLSTPDMTTAGTKTITVTYSVNGVVKTATFDINVVEIEKVLQSIEVTSMPTKTTYSLNETFNQTGLVVKANYNVGSSVEITNYTLSSVDMATVGEKTITVTYIEDGVMKTTTFKINVVEEIGSYVELPSIKATTTQYITTGITTTSNTQIVIKMQKPTNADVIDENGRWLFGSNSKNFGLCLKPNGAYVLDVGGTRYNTGIINWQDGLNTLVIGNGVYTINGNPLVSGLNVTTSATGALDFRLFGNPASSAINYLGAIVSEVTIYNGSNVVMHLIPAKSIAENKIGFYDTVGEKMLFSETESQFIEGPELVDAKLEAIEVIANPTTTEYAVNDEFSSEGLVVKAIYDNSSFKNVTNYTLSTPDMTTTGTKTITVTYEEDGVIKTTTFDITVVDVEKVLDSIEIVSNPYKTKYAINTTFSKEGLVVVANYNIGNPVTITNYSVSEPDMTTVGIKTITVTYEEGGVTREATFEIEVNELNYIALDHIIADGSQYFDSGYTPKANTKVVMTIGKPNDSLLTSTGRWLFNADIQNNGNNSEKDFGFNIKSDGAYVLDYGEKRTNTGTINWQDGRNTIVVGNGVFTVNGTPFSNPGVGTDAAETLYFLWARSNTTKTYCPATIYEISIYEGETLVMHLVPTMNDAGRIGLYDTVSETYIFSAVEGKDFTSKDYEGMGITYTELEYVRNDGSAYIDTGLKTTENTKVVITMDKPSNDDLSGGTWLFASSVQANPHNYGFNVKADGVYVLDIGGTRYQTGTINWTEGKNTITIGNGVFKINDGDLVTGLNVTTSPVDSTATLYILHTHNTESKATLPATIYEVSIYEGETLVMHLVPTQTSKGDVGFYDTVSGSFISASGGTLTAGPEALQE